MQDDNPSENKIRFNVDQAGDYFIFAASALCVGLIFVGGISIAYSMLIALLGTASIMYLLFEARKSKMGARIWNYGMNHPIQLDLALTVVGALMLGTTPTGLLAAGAAGVLNTAVIKILRKFMPNNGIVDMAEFNKKPAQSPVNTEKFDGKVFEAEFKAA